VGKGVYGGVSEGLVVDAGRGSYTVIARVRRIQTAPDDKQLAMPVRSKHWGIVA
jgi:hypothetical protein